MWNAIIFVILAIEAVLLTVFVIGRFKKRKINETALFLGAVVVLSCSLHLVPFLYGIDESSNVILGLLDCLHSSIKLFVGQSDVAAIEDFAKAFPHFSIAYMLGVVIALLTTISAAIEAFKDSIINGFRLSKALKKKSCDIVIGSTPKALKYAKGCDAVLLLGSGVGKSTVKELIEDGYAVLQRSFTKQTLASRQFNYTTRYNIICLESDKVLPYIDIFIDYKNSKAKAKNVYLYVELEGAEAETVRREIIEKNHMDAYISTFSTNELLARTFVEENPITKYLPDNCIENATVKCTTKINVFLLGFGKLGRELYRQSVMNNQLVTFDGEYKVFPINYFLCDTGINPSEWCINGLAEELNELKPSEHFPLPELPFRTTVIDKAPSSREVLSAVKAEVRNNNSYTLIIIDSDDDFINIEIGARLRSMLFGNSNYHLFVRSEAAYTENDDTVTYFGDSDSVFNHDVIVNDSLSVMAKKLNEIYFSLNVNAEERKRTDFAEYIKKEAEKDWNKLGRLVMYSNIYAAVNLRVKLNLLGLDYVKNTSGNNALIHERYVRKDKYTYEEYFTPSVRNALLAQEHARWNAYYMLNEYLPLSKSSITVKSSDDKKVRFNTQSAEAKRHACITTFNGINDLSSYLAEKAGGCTAADYDYYIYDELLIRSANELLTSLGYSVIEKGK